MPTIATFSLVKNESEFIVYHILSLLDFVNALYFYDGNSTDGTTEMIEHIQKNIHNGQKIHLFKGKDCINLKEDYTRLWNELMQEIKEDYCFFIHPDMIVLNPEKIRDIGKDDALAYYINIRSFSHDGKTEIIKGRYNWWKTICKNDFGLCYYGAYGSADEDMYFNEITGDNHVIYTELGMYPYEVKNSGLNVNHYCECKDYNKRFEKMVKCLRTLNPEFTEEDLKKMALVHPRVTLESGDSPFGLFEFKKTDEAMPDIFYDKRAKAILKKFKGVSAPCLN